MLRSIHRLSSQLAPRARTKFVGFSQQRFSFPLVSRAAFHSSVWHREENAAKSEDTPEVPLPPKVSKIIDDVMDLNVFELTKLVSTLKDKFGYVESAPMMMAAGAAPVGGPAAAAEEAEPEEEKPVQTIFSLKLESFDAKEKIKVIKEIRAITGLGIKQSKEMVEGVPCVIKEDLPKADAEALVEKIKSVGGVASIV